MCGKVEIQVACNRHTYSNVIIRHDSNADYDRPCLQHRFRRLPEEYLLQIGKNVCDCTVSWNENSALPLGFRLARAGDSTTRTLGGVFGSGGMVDGDAEPEVACKPTTWQYQHPLPS